METKKFKFEKEFEKLAQKMSDDEILLMINGNVKNGDLSILAVDDEEYDKNLVCVIAAIIETSLTGSEDEGLNRITRIILDALKLVQGSDNPVAGLRLATEMLEGVAQKVKSDINEIEEDGNCASCEFNSTCNDDDAIAYRKAHGIPRPKKGGKARKINVN